MHTLRQYLMSLSDPCGLTRTLGEVEVCRDATGRICFSVGNSAVVFRIRHEGRIRSLRGYLRPQRHLREIYGERLLEKELYLYTSTHSGEWVDVVIGDWIEGEDLHTAIAAAAGTGDTERLRRLSEGFDRLAAAMVADDRAHGDLKPENILVTADGELRPIDFDAAYLPCFAGETSPELGTAAYQHPARTAEDFNARLDDYPAALIATALHALSLDPSLWERYGGVDTLLYDPRRIATDRALQESIDRFEAQGMAVEYRMARLLYAPRPELPELGALLAEAVRRADCRRREEASRRGEQPPRRSAIRNRNGRSRTTRTLYGRPTGKRRIRRPRDPGTVRRGRPLGLPDTRPGGHPAALRQRIRLHRGAGRRAAGPHVALHRHGGAHAAELSGVRSGEALPRRPRPAVPQRTTVGDRSPGRRI